MFLVVQYSSVHIGTWMNHEFDHEYMWWCESKSWADWWRGATTSLIIIIIIIIIAEHGYIIKKQTFVIVWWRKREKNQKKKKQKEKQCRAKSKFENHCGVG